VEQVEQDLGNGTKRLDLEQKTAKWNKNRVRNTVIVKKNS
jgi:hypothetical protein